MVNPTTHTQQYAAQLGGTPQPCVGQVHRYAIRRSASSGVTARNAILLTNVNDSVPPQYITECTDCRLYWTQEMITDVSAIWTAVPKDRSPVLDPRTPSEPHLLSVMPEPNLICFKASR